MTDSRSRNAVDDNGDDPALLERVAKLKAQHACGVFAGLPSPFDAAGSRVTKLDMNQLSPGFKDMVIDYFKRKQGVAQAKAELMELVPFIKFDIEAAEREAFPARDA